MADLLEPKEVDVELPGGGTKKYILSKFPAVAGREIICKYPLSGLPKLGDYAINEETMFKLMGYVAVPVQGGQPLRLTTRVLIENHVVHYETLMKLEWSMMEYNCSFFLDGRVSTLLSAWAAKLPTVISSILTASLQQLSQTEKPPSTNSGPSTP